MTQGTQGDVPPKPMDRFRDRYRKLNPEEVAAMTAIKEHAHALEQQIDDLMPYGREKSLAFTHLEDCVMRAVRGFTE